jgi:transposase
VSALKLNARLPGSLQKAKQVRSCCLVATGDSVLTVIYHLLSDADARFCDLGPGYYESRINNHRRARDLATQLQALTGQHIAIRDGKAVITDTDA